MDTYRSIFDVIKGHYKDIILIAGSIATISLAAPLVENTIFYFRIAKSACEQGIATNNLVRERNSGDSTLKYNTKFLYPDNGIVKKLQPNEVAKEEKLLPFCGLIANQVKVREHEADFRKSGLAISNPYK